MKKAFLILLVGAMMLGSVGCGKKENSNDQSNTGVVNQDRTVVLDAIGLKYKTPEFWKGYEEKNIYPITHAIQDTFAQINYCYITDKTFESMNDLSAEIDTEKEYLSICEITVVPEENIESEYVKAYFEKYENVELVANQQGYNYYFMTNAKNDTSLLSEEEMDVYNKLKESAIEIKDSMELFEFDPSVLKDQNKSDYITFNSMTLEGEEISSKIFSENDVTLVNFWSVTDCYPERDNSQVLQDLYNKIKQEKVNYGVVQIIVDLPSPEGGNNETVAAAAKLNVNGQYTSIIMDETLVKFVMNNLEGLPTSFLVDKEGKILDDEIQGILSADTYYALMYNAIAENKYDEDALDEQQ